MDKELNDRLEKIEKQLSTQKKDFWEKLQAITPILIPLTIAWVGWYFTDQHNTSQLEIQKNSSEGQLQVAIINSTVGQSEMIQDFMIHLTGKDTIARNIAIEAILYAAPAPGKKIVERIKENSSGDANRVATDALNTKRLDLVSNLFSTQAQNRIIAANEITASWLSDDLIIEKLISRAENCVNNNSALPDCENGLYNTFVVLQNFSKSSLLNYKDRIQNLINKLPSSSAKTRDLGIELMKRIELTRK